jgi:hypothetical protein
MDCELRKVRERLDQVHHTSRKRPTLVPLSVISQVEVAVRSRLAQWGEHNWGRRQVPEIRLNERPPEQTGEKIDTVDVHGLQRPAPVLGVVGSADIVNMWDRVAYPIVPKQKWYLKGPKHKWPADPP